MKKFTKREFAVVCVTLVFITVVTSLNMVKAIRRARDAQRKVDIGILSDALHEFQVDYGFFPRSSEEGQVIACKNEKFDEVAGKLSKLPAMDFDILYEGLRPCVWGVDRFEDLFSSDSKPYLSTFPSDPKTALGYSYYYISNGTRFQIYSYLEGHEEETGYDSGIVSRNLKCGSGICSFGKSYGNTPLNKTIEDFEKELLLKSK